MKSPPSESPDSTPPRENEAAARLDEVTHERNLYAKTLAEANRLYEEKVRELNALRRVGDALRSVQSVRKVSCEIVDILVEEVGAKNCSLMLLDRDEGTLSIAAARGQLDSQARYVEGSGAEGRFKLGEGVAGWVAQHAEPVLIPDTAQDGRFKRAEAGGLDIRSLLCLPLVEGNQVWGVLNLSHSDINAFTEDNERILTIIANQAGIALANVGLFRQLNQMNAALSESEARYRALFEKSTEAIFLMSDSGRIVNANDRWTQLTGMSPAESEQLTLDAREDGPALTLHEWTRRAGLSELVVPELTLTRSDGARRIIELRLNPIDVMGQRAVLGVAHDITRRKELEEQLLRSEKLAAMGTLAASVAHEINNPLEGIKNCLNLLKTKLPPGEKDAELLDLVEKGFVRIRDIVRKVLDFHRPAATVMEPLDLNTVLLGLVGLFRNDFSNRNVKLVLDLAPHLEPVSGNRSHLEQVFTNIILNAEDAMDKGGSLTVTSAHDAGEVTVLFVDTGHGISKEDMKNVLQPFFTRKRSGKGTGLGLWISHSVIQDHRGRLEISSEPGHGTTVSVILPVLAPLEE